jgi:hypothetical protein
MFSTRASEFISYTVMQRLFTAFQNTVNNVPFMMMMIITIMTFVT